MAILISKTQWSTLGLEPVPPHVVTGTLRLYDLIRLFNQHNIMYKYLIGYLPSHVSGFRKGRSKPSPHRTSRIVRAVYLPSTSLVFDVVFKNYFLLFALVG